ncbi:MAG: hypothetical protein WC340_06260 [Kiritimatiellia bacterium]
MPLIERLLHPILADDSGDDSGLRLKIPPLKIVNHHRRRYRKPTARLTFSRSDWKPDLRFCETL